MEWWAEEEWPALEETHTQFCWCHSKWTGPHSWFVVEQLACLLLSLWLKKRPLLIIRAWFESQATSRFLYFIKGLPSANDSLSEKMAPNQETGYMADWAVQLQLNGYTLTGSGNFHSLSSKSWRGFSRRLRVHQGGIDRRGNSRWNQSWHASHLQLP